MIFSLTGFLSALRQASPIISLIVAIASGIMICLAPEQAATLGVDTLREKFHGYIGATFILSVSVLSAHCLSTLFKIFKGQIQSYVDTRKKKQQLHSLTPDEKAYLLPYIEGQETTQYFGLDDGIAMELQIKEILFQAANLGNLIGGWAFSLQPLAREYLQEKPELLEGANPKPRKAPY